MIYSRMRSAFQAGVIGEAISVRPEEALKGGGGGGGEPCDLVTLVKALPGAASSRGGDEGAGDDEALAGGERALCSATRLTLGGEATSEARRASRAWSRAPVRKATSKVRLAGEV